MSSGSWADFVRQLIGLQGLTRSGTFDESVDDSHEHPARDGFAVLAARGEAQLVQQRLVEGRQATRIDAVACMTKVRGGAVFVDD
jgi:hypothetical protein